MNRRRTARIVLLLTTAGAAAAVYALLHRSGPPVEMSRHPSSDTSEDLPGSPPARESSSDREPADAQDSVPGPLPASSELALDSPDDQLTLVYPGLRGLVRDIAIMPWMSEGQRKEHEDCVQATFVDPDQLVVATDVAQLARLHPYPLEVQLDLRDGTWILVQRTVRSRSRDTVLLELPATIASTSSAPLRLIAQGVRGESFDEPFDLRLFSRDDASQVRTQPQPWGRIQVHPPTIDLRREVHLDSAPLVLEEVPLGAEYCVTVVHALSGTGARQIFRHSGNDVLLQLVKGSRVHGTFNLFKDKNREVWPRHMSVMYEPTAGDGLSRIDALAWRHEFKDVPVDESGAFSFAIPAEVPIKSEAQFPIPPRITLALAVPGYDPTKREVLLDLGRDLWLGPIELQARSPHLIVEAVDGWDLNALRFGRVRISGSASSAGHEISHAEHGEDRCVRIWLNQTGRHPAAWPAQPAPFALITTNAGQSYPFRMLGDGKYGRMETRHYSITMTASNERPENVTDFGVAWKGIKVRTGSLAGWAGRAHDVAEFEAPVEGVEFWWSRRGTNVVHTRNLTSSQVEIRMDSQ